MDTKKGRQHSGFAALLLDSIYYLAVSYGLECFLLSWRTNPLFIVVFSCRIYLISMYWKTLKNKLPNWWACAAVFALITLLEGTIFWFWGYFPIPSIPRLLH